jgi:predicted nucleic acid-binding Zn ribbon protein
LLLKEWCEVKQRYWGLVGMLGLGLSLTLAGCGGGGGGGGSSALGSDTRYTTSNVTVSTVAGSSSGFVNSTIGTNAKFNGPTGLALNSAKTYLYVADTGNDAIRTVKISSKVVDTFYNSSLSGPEGLVFKGTDLYVCDTESSFIRTIDSDASGVVFVSAGTLNYPTGIYYDGSYFYVADQKNNVIRRISTDGTAITRWAGSDSYEAGVDGSTYTDPTISADSAKFNNPYGVTSDGTYLYVTDCGNSTIRKIAISGGDVTILAGLAGTTGYEDSTDDDGTGETATFKNPKGIAYYNQYLYVADTGNHIIRKVDISNGKTTTIAGYKGVTGSTDGTTGNAAKFNSPTGIVVLVSGGNVYLYVADTGNHRIRMIQLE